MKNITLHRLSCLYGALVCGLLASPAFASHGALSHDNAYQVSAHGVMSTRQVVRQLSLSGPNSDVTAIQAYFRLKNGERVFGDVTASDDESFTVVTNESVRHLRRRDVKWFWYTTPPQPVPYHKH